MLRKYAGFVIFPNIWCSIFSFWCDCSTYASLSPCQAVCTGMSAPPTKSVGSLIRNSLKVALFLISFVWVTYSQLYIKNLVFFTILNIIWHLLTLSIQLPAHTVTASCTTCIPFTLIGRLKIIRHGHLFPHVFKVLLFYKNDGIKIITINKLFDSKKRVLMIGKFRCALGNFLHHFLLMT